MKYEIHIDDKLAFYYEYSLSQREIDYLQKKHKIEFKYFLLYDKGKEETTIYHFQKKES